MLDSFFLVFKNTFLYFFIIPLSEGSYYSIATTFFGPFMPFLAKIFGIWLAILVNYLAGFFFAKIFKISIKFKPGKMLKIALPLLCAFPFVSGLISFYFGALGFGLYKEDILKKNFPQFAFLAFFASFAFYAALLFFPNF